MPEDNSGPDLQIDYDMLHEMAADARELKGSVEFKVPELASGTGDEDSDSGAVGDSELTGALRRFRVAWHKPFKDSMDRLEDLALLLDGVATKFFDMDADFAQQASSLLSRQAMSTWESKKNQHDLYLKNKDLMFTPSPIYDENGALVNQAPVHLFKYGDGEGETPVPEDAGDRPAGSDYFSNSNKDGDEFAHSDKAPTAEEIKALEEEKKNRALTETTYDKEGRVKIETSTVTSTSGLGYSETTSYDYEIPGFPDTPSKVTTTITHSDGTTETIVTTYQANGNSTVKSSFQDPKDSDNDSSSTTTVTPDVEKDADGKVVKDFGYESVTVDDDGKTTTTTVTNNDPNEIKTKDDYKTFLNTDTKVVTDEDGVRREYTGNYESDTWTQTGGPPENETDEDDEQSDTSDDSGPVDDHYIPR
ncbi:hypothetical protein [Kineosporia sp. NBRC 101731]|uniref:hypothetical protein n=1 Tax=Kineosporia sp. NBRC 101731 TaxID=3032199 RepID=UPI0024A0F594|nr:hypothetical protein [Kineosporia sp. NBRC 101731]GLY29872.1 hypothetical protein Kisp02_32370 [Kineosporia sp. NBRC 101731]